MTKIKINGSVRRMVAFVAALALIAASGALKLDGAAIAAIVTLTLGYVGQGALKDASVAKAQAAAWNHSLEGP